MVARRSCWFVQGYGLEQNGPLSSFFLSLGLGLSLLLFSAALPNCRAGRILPDRDRDGGQSVFASVRRNAKAQEAPNRLWPLGSTKKVIGSSGELWPSLAEPILGTRPGCATAREGWAVRNVTAHVAGETLCVLR